MLTEEQLIQTQELLTNAINYNAALHAAFVSEDDMVEVDLHVNGIVEKVSVPTYHYLLKQVNRLATMVSQMQITNDGSDVVQLLTASNNLALLYLQKRQYYVQSPTGAKIVKYDYETVPTAYSSIDRTAIFIDMTNCRLPMDAQFVIAGFEDGTTMQLPLQFKTTTFDKLANVLSVNGSGNATTYFIDSNDFAVGDNVQCNSTVYTVTSVSGQSIQLECEQPSIIKTIQAGDVLYGITDASVALLEVPVHAMHTRLSLQVQYMQLLSAKAYYDISDMSNAVHQSRQIPLKDCLLGLSNEAVLGVAGLALRPVANDLDSIIANSVPKITKTTVRQSNTHQYVHSVLETMVKTNAILVQAKQDIHELEQLIATTTSSILAAGGDATTNEALLAYNDQLASAKNRYQAAQASLANANVSAQAVRPEYVATIYCSPNDAAGAPIVQYVVRYQYLSFEVKDVKNNWQYAYGYKRTVDKSGHLAHDIDDYDILNNIELPIHAYEQLVVQVAAVLQYGQPYLNIQTDWSDTLFLTIPDNLTKEVSIDEMFKNAYEAKLYTNIQQAMEAAGVFRHINTNVTYAHRAQDIQYDNDDTVYTKLQQLLRSVAALESTAATGSLNVYVLYAGQYYPVGNGSQISLTAVRSYSKATFGDASGAALQELLGTVVEEQVQLLIVNDTSSALYLHTMIPGLTSDKLTEAAYQNYANLPIMTKQVDGNNQYYITNAPTYGMAAYRGKLNSAGNRNLVVDDTADWCYIDAARGIINVNNAMALSGIADATMHATADTAENAQQKVLLVRSSDAIGSFARKATQDYPGIGIHNDMPLYLVNSNAKVAVPDNDTAADELGDKSPIIQMGYMLGMQAPKVDVQISSGAVTPAGGKLAEAYVQPSMFSIDNYMPLSCFVPQVHKYTSGRASRGAFFFLQPESMQVLQLPVYGTSNAMQIEPGSKEQAGLVIPCLFQARMTDRLGLTDTKAKVNVELDGNLAPAVSGTNFAYTKTMNISVKTGLTTISFDLSMTMQYYD